MQDKKSTEILGKHKKNFNLEGKYTVDSLIETLGMFANNRIWQSFEGQVNVKGKVASVRIWSSFCYIDLKSETRTVTARCGLEDAPKQGECIVFRGLVKIKTAKSSKLDIEIIGAPVGTWKPKNENIKELALLSKDRIVPLSSLFSQNQKSKIIILGTARANKDVSTQLGECDCVVFKEIKVQDKSQLFSDLLKVNLNGYNAIGVTRGGSDGLLHAFNDSEIVSFFLSLDIPFYTAIGHAGDVTLIEKYSDQPFATPSNLGSALKETIKLTRYLSSAENLISINKELEEKLNIANQKNAMPKPVEIVIKEKEIPKLNPVNTHLIHAVVILSILVTCMYFLK